MWYAHIDAELSRADVAASILNCVRTATAEWLGAPEPKPLLANPIATDAGDAPASNAIGSSLHLADAGFASSAVLGRCPQAGIWPPSAAPPTSAGTGSATRGSPRRSTVSSCADPLMPGTRDPSVLCRLRLTDPRYVMKVTPDRIYSVAMHPAPSRLIALAGDSSGHLGVWVPDAGVPGSIAPEVAGDPIDADPAAVADADDREGRTRAASAKDADDDDANEQTRTIFAPHVSPINYIQIPRGAPHLVVTSSFDGSLRALDLNAGASWELSTAALERGYVGLATGGRASKYVCGFSAFDVTAFDPVDACDGMTASSPGLVLVAGGYNGAGFVIDTRARPDAPPAAAWAAHEGKVTAVSALHRGTAPHVVLTSCSSPTAACVCLWDVRRLPPPKALADGSHGSSAAKPLLRVPHRLGVINAFFSPHGTRAVSACNDDVIRIWDVIDDASGGITLGTSPDAPRVSIPHNNHTGQWLSQLRPVFDPANDTSLLIGAMGTQALEVWSATTGAKLGALTSSLVTAVPTLNAVHPSPHVAAAVSGTASGRMYMWR